MYILYMESFWKNQKDHTDHVVHRKFLGGLLNRFLPKLPKAFRKFVEAHKDEPITSFVVYRSPLDKVSSTFLNTLTLGDWDNIKKKANVDKLFHIYAIINGKYIYEKLSVPVLKNASGGDLDRSDAESMNAPINKTVTIGDFVDKAIKRMGDDYYTYDGFKNNCQDFLSNSLSASGLGNSAIQSFLKQDTKRLVEETPEYSKYLGKEITDLAGAATKAWSELVDKRGGIRHHNRAFDSHKNKRLH